MRSWEGLADDRPYDDGSRSLDFILSVMDLKVLGLKKR